MHKRALGPQVAHLLNECMPKFIFCEDKHSNIKLRDVQRKNVVNNVDMSNLKAP